MIRKKLKMQGLKEGSGVKGKDQSSYDNEEMLDLIVLTRCFLKIKINESSKQNWFYKRITCKKVDEKQINKQEITSRWFALHTLAISSSPLAQFDCQNEQFKQVSF